MSDKQYDGMLLDLIANYERLIEIAEQIPDSPEKEALMKELDKQKTRTERKLETPIAP